MVYLMLINTHNNKMKIEYKQQVTINKVKTGKGYEYKEITIPTDLIRYYSTIIHEEVTTIYYVLSNYNGNIKIFVTPVEVTSDTDISLLYPSADVTITPDKVIKIPVKIHGNKKKNPRYIFRINKKFKLTEDYIVFTVNPYAFRSC